MDLAGKYYRDGADEVFMDLIMLLLNLFYLGY